MTNAEGLTWGMWNSVEVKEPRMSCCGDLGKYLDGAELERYLREHDVGAQLRLNPPGNCYRYVPLSWSFQWCRVLLKKCSAKRVRNARAVQPKLCAVRLARKM